MASVSECQKCGSSEIGFGKRTPGFSCGHCDWTPTYEELMEI